METGFYWTSFLTSVKELLLISLFSIMYKPKKVTFADMFETQYSTLAASIATQPSGKKTHQRQLRQTKTECWHRVLPLFQFTIICVHCLCNELKLNRIWLVRIVYWFNCFRYFSYENFSGCSLHSGLASTQAHCIVALCILCTYVSSDQRYN